MKRARIHAMVLAAGLGTRLRPLTDTVPKPAVLVGGKPLIFYALENLKRLGVDRVVINTHHLADKIRNTVSSATWPFEVIFIHETELLGTGGAIRNAQRYLTGCDAILTYNGDAIVEHDLKSISNAHIQHQPLSTMLLKQVENVEAFGAVTGDESGRVRDIIGKVGEKGSHTRELMYCGVQLLSPEIFEFLPKSGVFCILREGLIPALKEHKIVRYEQMQGFFCDVGTKERLDLANQHFAKSGRESTSPYST